MASRPAAPKGAFRGLSKRRSRVTERSQSARIRTASAAPKFGLLRAITCEPIEKALMALKNNEIKSTVEVKSGGDTATKTEIIYPKEILAAMKGMFGAGKAYRFEIHTSLTLASIGGGVFNLTLSWNPGSQTYSEWTALAALFDEVLLIRSHLYLTSAFGPTSTAIIFQVAVAPDETTTSGGTPSFTTVLRRAESELIHPYLLGRGPDGRFHKAHRISRGRPYATTAAPTGASGIPAGLLGHWAFASNIAGTASINYLFATCTNVISLRCRA